ncbi:hypothetical protein Q3G72_010936 [Acer saccharum]|nr:hypothetical protein Q3G72_010936 [Acer saccharum]
MTSRKEGETRIKDCYGAVFSPANKAFSFGHPDVESIIDRFLSRNPQPDSAVNRLIEAHRNTNIHKLNIELTNVLKQLEDERNRAEALDEMRKASRKQCWWESPIAELGSCELEQLRMALEELKKKVAEQANKILVESTNTSPFFKVNAYENETKPNDQSSVAATNMYTLGYSYNYGLSELRLHNQLFNSYEKDKNHANGPLKVSPVIRKDSGSRISSALGPNVVSSSLKPPILSSASSDSIVQATLATEIEAITQVDAGLGEIEAGEFPSSDNSVLKEEMVRATVVEEKKRVSDEEKLRVSSKGGQSCRNKSKGSSSHGMRTRNSKNRGVEAGQSGQSECMGQQLMSTGSAEDEAANVLAVGSMLGVDFSGIEDEMLVEITRREEEDAARFEV